MPRIVPTPEASLTRQPARELACEVLYRFLAATLADPRWPGRPGPCNDEPARQLVEAAVRELVEVPQDAAGHAPASAATFAAIGDDEVAPLVASAAAGLGQTDAYDRVFGLVTCHDCPPYETEYQPVTDAFFRAQEMADIAGFYRAFGFSVRRELGERPDHIALELEFMALLLAKRRLALDEADAAQAHEKNGSAAAHEEGDPPRGQEGGGWARALERAAVCEEAQRAFFRDHLGWWAGGFAQLVWQKAESGPLAAASRLLALLIAKERERLKLPANQRSVAPRLPVPEPCEECLGGQEALESDLPLVENAGCNSACARPTLRSLPREVGEPRP